MYNIVEFMTTSISVKIAEFKVTFQQYHAIIITVFIIVC